MTTEVRTIDQLREQFESIRATGSVKDVLALAKQITVAEAAAERAERDAVNAAAKAEYEAKAAIFAAITEPLAESVKRAASKAQSACVEAEVNALRINVAYSADGLEPAVSVLLDGPGVPKLTKTRKASNGGTGARGRNVYVSPTGERIESTRDFLARFNVPVPDQGMTHKARAVATQQGWTVESVTNGA